MQVGKCIQPNIHSKAIGQQIQLMTQLLEAQGQMAALDDYPEVDMEMVETEVPVSTATGAVVKAFTRRAAAGSPSKVAKDHLKPKEGKKTAEVKETG